MSYTSISSRIVKIRKPLMCFGCNQNQEVGATIKRNIGKFEGEFTETNLCRVCDSYLDAHRYDFDDGFSQGELKWEDEEGWEKIRASIESPSPEAKP